MTGCRFGIVIVVDSDFAKFLVHRGKYWEVYISERGGNNLGRLYIWLIRDGIVELDALTEEEVKELRHLHRVFKHSLLELWQPKLVNVAQLMNEESHGHHCHWHLVPRYPEPRTFEGVSFTDVSWGTQWTSAKMDAELAVRVGEALMQVAGRLLKPLP